MIIKNVWYEFDEWEREFDIYNETSIVHFDTEDGSRWCAEFYTYQYLLTLSEKNKKTGELLEGQYFYGDKPIFISKLDKELIKTVIIDILDNNKAFLDDVFTRVNA